MEIRKSILAHICSSWYLLRVIKYVNDVKRVYKKVESSGCKQFENTFIQSRTEVFRAFNDCGNSKWFEIFNL